MTHQAEWFTCTGRRIFDMRGGTVPSHLYYTVRLSDMTSYGASSPLSSSGGPASDQDGPSFESFETLEKSPRAESRENSPTAMHQTGSTEELSLIPKSLHTSISSQIGLVSSSHPSHTSSSR